MPLPTNRELREMLDEATPGPWGFDQLDQQLAGCPPSVGFWVFGEDSRYIATADVLSEDYDQTERGFTLIALAPQLAEEVIRLREEIDRLKWHCRDSEQVADAETRLADNEREKAWQEGRAEAYYDTYLQITQEQHKENHVQNH